MPPLIPALTDQEKVQIRHHLGYVNVGEIYTYVLGTPAGLETQFIIEGAMQRVLPAAFPLLRKILGYLDIIEGQRIEDLDVMVATQVDTIRINPDEQLGLETQYDKWVGALENVLGCPRNVFDKRKFGQPGGINARVQG